MHLYFVSVYYNYHNVYIGFIINIFNMKVMNDKTTIGVTRITWKKLNSAKFDFRVNTLEEALERLLEEHENEVKA